MLGHSVDETAAVPAPLVGPNLPFHHHHSALFQPLPDFPPALAPLSGTGYGAGPPTLLRIAPPVSSL